MKNSFLLVVLLISLPAWCQKEVDILKDVPESSDFSNEEYVDEVEYSVLLKGASSEKQRVLDSLSYFIQNYRHDDSVKVNALNELSKQYLWIDFYISLARADSALSLARRLEFHKGIATAYNLKGFCFWAFGDNELAIKMALQASELMGKRSPTILTESFLVLSRGYTDLREHDKGRDYIIKAEKIASQTKNWAQLSSVYNWIGVLHIVDNKRDSALLYFNKALQIAENHAIPKIEFPRIISNIGECHLKQNPKLAFDYFDKALLLARETSNKTAEASISAIIGQAFLDKGDYAIAENYLQSSLQLARTLGLRRVLRHVYGELVDLRMKQGRAPEAVDYLKTYYRVRDSLYGASKTRQLLELEAGHEIEKKEQAIKLLEQEKHIQTIWRNFLIAGVFLLAIASYLIYRLHRSRARKANQLLEFQQTLNDKLKGVDKLKTQFFANISHEFRTPLSLILAPLEEELKKRMSKNADTELLLLMKRNANRLLELVNQLLDLSKLEAGKMELKIRRSNFAAFIKILAASFDSWAQHKNIQFEKNINIPGDSLWFDQDKVEKIVTNLLANAFKFTPGGGEVTLDVNVVQENGKTSLSMTISDTGKGIPIEEQNKIFLPFYQARHTVESYHPGTGLGLSLVRELVKLYGGNISLKSESGKGTAITILLPIEENAFQTEQIFKSEQDIFVTDNTTSVQKIYAGSGNGTDDDHEHAVEGKDTVLVAEDNADLRNFITSILESQYSVYTAVDGEEAMQMALRYVPSLILSDLMMPKMDGIQLVEKIKADERTSHIPVVLLTAKNESQSRLAGLKTGVDDYLTKPFSTEELLVRIGNLIQQRKQLAVRFRERILVPITPTHEDSLDDKFLQKVRSVVEANMGEFTFGVEQLAEEINLSRTQLLRKLKALTGLSPNEFIKDLRLKKAADMIRLKADTITQIGYTVGFNDQSYFTKCFKKQFGVTPSDYSLQFGRHVHP